MKPLSRLIAVALTLLLLFAACSKKSDHNEDSSSNLGHWGRAMSAIPILAEGGDPQWFGGLKDGTKEDAAQKLESGFAVTDRAGLIVSMQFHLMSGARVEYRYDADALRQLQELDEQQRKDALDALTDRQRLHYQLVDLNLRNWGDRGLLAYDMSRAATLAMLGYRAELLTHEEAQAVMQPMAAVLQQQFSGWADVNGSILDAYALVLLDGQALPEDMRPENMLVTHSVEGGPVRQYRDLLQGVLDTEPEKNPLFDDALFSAELIPLKDLPAVTADAFLQP